MIGNKNLDPGGRRRPGQPRRLGNSRHRRQSSLGWTTVGWLSAALALLLVAASLGAYFRYRGVWGSIRRIHVSGLGKRPPQDTGAPNILLIGSDSRAGANAELGAGTAGQRSDTIMILHISPGHQDATVLSIPRDSMVPILSCAPAGPGTPGQQAAPGQAERINAAFASGGPACLWKTVEYETGIRIDHFIALAFTGFERIINDIGGVNVCVPEPVDDPDSGLRLTPGLHHVMGAEALAFWRERHIGTGSDLQRIERDQYLMASLLQGIAHSDILASPSRIYSIVVDAASAMTTDTGLDLATMLRIAESLRGLSSGSVHFVQVPEVPYPPDPAAEVTFEQPRASELFSAISRDTTAAGPAAPKRTGTGSRRRHSAAPSAPTSPSPSASASRLTRRYGGISGNARACHDQAAFAGGDAPSDFPNP